MMERVGGQPQPSHPGVIMLDIDPKCNCSSRLRGKESERDRGERERVRERLCCRVCRACAGSGRVSFCRIQFK